MGKEAFADFCVFAVGCQFLTLGGEKNTQTMKNIVVHARGSIPTSIRMQADLADLAAINISKHTGKPYKECLKQVLDGFQHELTNMRREVLE